MSFDKWFNSQDRLVQVILLVIPFVGWIVECLVRLSVALRTKSIIHIVVLLLFLFVGWTWILCEIHRFYIFLNGTLILAK